MKKQAKKAPAEAKDLQIPDQSAVMDLQMRFSRLSPDQRLAVGNYLNAYNLAAWIYNDIIDEDSRIYIDLAMKYTLETYQLSKDMYDISEDSKEVDKLVKRINHGE